MLLLNVSSRILTRITKCPKVIELIKSLLKCSILIYFDSVLYVVTNLRSCNQVRRIHACGGWEGGRGVA